MGATDRAPGLPLAGEVRATHGSNPMTTLRSQVGSARNNADLKVQDNPATAVW
jgi:hypothetical protein